MRKQRAFASLTEAEIQQIAEWLRHETYEVVLERLRKPRPDGFGLDISKRPLETLYAKTNRVERINNRIASGQRLTLAEFDAIQAGEKADVAEEIHDAIMDETHAMATSGENTPTQLLALQRLADFPARADYRAHKVQMDLERGAQKKEMDEHRKRMNEERLALSKRSLDLRETQLAARAAEKSAIRISQSAMSDDLGPLASTLDEIEARATRKFNLPPLPGSSPNSIAPESSPQPATDPSITRNELPSAAGASSASPISVTPDSQSGVPSETNARTVSTVSPQPSVVNSSDNPQSAIRIPQCVESSLEKRVSDYTLARHYEAAHGKNPRIVGKYAAWNFKSKMQWCPCGNQQLPCPDHGDFPKYFWEISPDSADFTAVLRAKKLPFIPHYQLLREQEEQQQRILI